MTAILKILSYNVRGLNSPIKRGRLWVELQHWGADVVFLQETHFKSSSIPSLPQNVLNQWYHAVSPIARARGVTIAFKKSCPWTTETLQSDPEGRYLFVKGTLQGRRYTFASIYSPNVGTANFLVKVFRKLEEFKEGCVVVGGDFNMVLEPSIDTSTGRTAVSFKAIKRVKQILRSQHLVDTWRALHPGIRDYSYYSKIHDMYSWLDLFLVDQFYLGNVSTSTIEPITMSDHAPMILTLQPTQMTRVERTWRLNESLLDKEDIVEKLKVRIKEYFEINKMEGVSDQVVWEAHKAVVRGDLIAIGTYMKKESKREMDELLEKIRTLEIKHKENLDPVDGRRLESVRAELAQYLEYKANNKIRFFANRA